MNLKKIILVIVMVVFGLSVYKYFFKSWTPYFQEKLYKDPRPLLVQALQIFDEDPAKEKNALDLGAGAGNDTAFLLKNGWTVWANDREVEAIRIIPTRKDIEPYKEKLTLIQSGFADLPWDSFPQFNLIYAGYSLPFLDKDSFYHVWNNIVNALVPNGLLAVHFFGDKHEGFNAFEKRSMSFFIKEEILDLFKGFDIKIFEESCDKNDHGVMDYSFGVVGKKR